MHDLEAFAAVIYSSNFEYEVAESASTTAPQSEGDQPSPHSQPVAGSTAEVEETEPRPVLESTLLESAEFPPSDAAAESAHSGAEQESGGGFESAWQKALAREDGQQVDS